LSSSVRNRSASHCRISSRSASWRYWLGTLGPRKTWSIGFSIQARSVWRGYVDRLGRSLQDLVGFLSELHALRVDLFLRQQALDTTTPAGKAMFQMLGVFAEFERSRNESAPGFRGPAERANGLAGLR
jgi:hypothetical protein